MGHLSTKVARRAGYLTNFFQCMGGYGGGGGGARGWNRLAHNIPFLEKWTVLSSSCEIISAVKRLKFTWCF